jgi:membrane associated rhomboid family serine protease
MIPLKDTIRSRSFPIINWIIIILNGLVFYYELRLGPNQLNDFINHYALVPARIELFNPFTWSGIFTSMFIHGGWLHILGNLWVLFIFGDNVEDRMGSIRYLIFYLLSGLAAGFMQTFADPTSTIPSIGASGAIAGVLGAYFSFFPRAKVLTLIPIFIIPWFIEVSAWIFLGFWFITQLIPGVLSLGGHSAGGIAWWAHVGGFLFGLILSRLFTIRRKPVSYHPDEYWPW